MLETNSTNKCPLPKCSHNTNRRDLDKPCSISYPMTQSKEWNERFDEIFPEFGFPKGTRNERMKDFIKATLRTELESLLQEMPEDNSPTLCGNCNLNGKLCKECYANRRANAALSTMREVISKRTQQYGGQ